MRHFYWFEFTLHTDDMCLFKQSEYVIRMQWGMTEFNDATIIVNRDEHVTRRIKFTFKWVCLGSLPNSLFYDKTNWQLICNYTFCYFDIHFLHLLHFKMRCGKRNSAVQGVKKETEIEHYVQRCTNALYALFFVYNKNSIRLPTAPTQLMWLFEAPKIDFIRKSTTEKMRPIMNQ